MASLKEWQANLKTYGGELVVWINQGDSPTLKSANSNGVCAAMFIDWMQCLKSQYSINITMFTKRFATSWFGVPSTNVPELYLNEQQKLKTVNDKVNDELKAAVDNLDAIDIEIIRLSKIRQDTEDDDERKQLMNAVLAKISEQTILKDSLPNYYKIAYGGWCTDLTSIPYDELEQSIRDKSNLFGLGISIDLPNGSHIVGIRLKIDQPEFFDANLGWFRFKNIEDLLKFFIKEVIGEFYSKIIKNNKIRIYSYA